MQRLLLFCGSALRLYLTSVLASFDGHGASEAACGKAPCGEAPGEVHVVAQRARHACGAVLQQNAGQASLPRWLVVARDCLGVRSQAAARAVRARDAPAIAVAAVPSSDAAGVVAAAFARDGGASVMHRVDVEAVMGGDGSVDSKGLCAEVGHLYGSPQAVAPHALFEPIEIDALLFDGAPASVLRLRTYAVSGARKTKRATTVPSCTVPRTPLTRQWRDASRGEYVCSYVREWLLMHTGVAVVIGHIGARAPVSMLREMHYGDINAVFAKSPSYGCLDGALINGVFSRAGRQAAELVQKVLDADGLWAVDLSTLDAVLQRTLFTGLRCRVRRAPVSASVAMNDRDKSAALRWL
eukprot:IDg23018t1